MRLASVSCSGTTHGCPHLLCPRLKKFPPSLRRGIKFSSFREKKGRRCLVESIPSNDFLLCILFVYPKLAEKVEHKTAIRLFQVGGTKDAI